MANDKDFIVNNPVEIGGSTKVTIGSSTTGTENYSLSSLTNEVTFSVTSQQALPQGLFLKSDGTRLFVAGRSPNEVFSYTLSTAWDLSTASYDSKSFSVNSQEPSCREVFLSSDGTKMYVCGSSADTVFEYDMSTAYDLSTASYNSVSFSVSSQSTAPTGLYFKPDGTKMYMVGVSNTLYQYSLSTAWDMSTASYDSVSATLTNNSFGIEFSSDGTLLFTVSTDNNIDKYTLSTAWDLSTITYVTTAESTGLYGVRLKSDGSKIYAVNQTSDTIIQYSSTVATETLDLSTGNLFTVNFDETKKIDFANAGSAQSFQVEITGTNVATGFSLADAGSDNAGINVASQDTNPNGIGVSADGTKIYMTGLLNDYIYQYNLSTADNALTATYNSFYDIGATTGQPYNFHFKPDGTKLYQIGSASVDTVYQFSLSTAWEISTLSYDSKSFGYVSQDTFMSDIFIKPDGTKMFLLGSNNDTIYQYTLSTAWDVSTASYDSVSGYIGATSSVPHGMLFKSDGTAVLVVDKNSDDVYEFSLSTAWDISTISYTGTNFDVNRYGQVYDATGIAASDDQLKFYVPTDGTSNGDRIAAFSMSKPNALEWYSGIQWQDGTAPATPEQDTKDIYTFVTEDGGTTYTGFKSGDNIS